MTNFIYTTAKYLIGRGSIDFVNDDLRAMLCMSGSTVGSEEDTATIGAFTVLNEYDGGNYSVATGGEQLTSVTYTTDSGNNLAMLDAATTSFDSISAGSDVVTSILIYKFVTNTGSSQPIAHIDNFAAFNGNGGTVSIVWSSSGIIRVT